MNDCFNRFGPDDICEPSAAPSESPTIKPTMFPTLQLRTPPPTSRPTPFPTIEFRTPQPTDPVRILTPSPTTIPSSAPSLSKGKGSKSKGSKSKGKGGKSKGSKSKGKGGKSKSGKSKGKSGKSKGKGGKSKDGSKNGKGLIEYYDIRESSKSKNGKSKSKYSKGSKARIETYEPTGAPTSSSIPSSIASFAPTDVVSLERKLNFYEPDDYEDEIEEREYRMLQQALDECVDRAIEVSKRKEVVSARFVSWFDY